MGSTESVAADKAHMLLDRSARHACTIASDGGTQPLQGHRQQARPLAGVLSCSCGLDGSVAVLCFASSAQLLSEWLHATNLHLRNSESRQRNLSRVGHTPLRGSVR